MIALVIIAVAYALIVWRVLSNEDRLKRSVRAVDDLQQRVAHLEDELALEGNRRLLAEREAR